MKISINGIVREMTTEEEAEINEAIARHENDPAPEPTPEERIASLEEELKTAKILLGLEDA